MLSKNEISNLQQSLEAIRAESLTDPLTGLGNRKYFDRMIATAVQDALATGEPLSLLMFDIDHFKSFNDSYGHLTGDQVLRLVGLSLKQTIKGQDITARYGGEEFVVIADDMTRAAALAGDDDLLWRCLRETLRFRNINPGPWRVSAREYVIERGGFRRRPVFEHPFEALVDPAIEGSPLRGQNKSAKAQTRQRAGQRFCPLPFAQRPFRRFEDFVGAQHALRVAGMQARSALGVARAQPRKKLLGAQPFAQLFCARTNCRRDRGDGRKTLR